jgi:hypothetical protein
MLPTRFGVAAVLALLSFQCILLILSSQCLCGSCSVCMASICNTSVPSLLVGISILLWLHGRS